ncbi:MAG: ParA family protein [Coleofasciculaceae cyanobacterium]
MSSSPRLIVVANGKGGVGKTTTAMALSGILSEQYKVLAVDSDRQGSLSWWVQRGGENISFDLTQETNPALLSKLRKIEGYDWIVVDTPPALRSEALSAVVALADYVILPTPPAPMDLAALIETVRLAIAPLNKAHRVLLTRVDSRSLKEAKAAQNTLREVGVPAFQAFIRTYKAHQRAALEGIPINQCFGDNVREAKADYCRIADELESYWRN